MKPGLPGCCAGLCACLLRGAVLVWLITLCWADLPAAQWRDRLHTLPDHDFHAEAEAWRRDGAYDEALLAIEAGLIDAEPGRADRLRALRERVRAEQDSIPRRIGEIGRGAWTGQGESAEALGGAVVADLLVFGDVRDLVIQSGRALRGEDTDEVIVALSAAGILLTAAPALDLGAAVLKTARRAGALGARFARGLARLARRTLRSGDTRALAAVLEDAAALTRRARPKPALRILRPVDEPTDLAYAARLAARPGGAYALHAGGSAAIRWGRVSGKAGERWLLRASRKGPRGLEMLGDAGRALLRPHPLLGLLKGLWKGTVPALLRELIEAWSTALLGVLLAWLTVETLLFSQRARRLRGLLA